MFAAANSIAPLLELILEVTYRCRRVHPTTMYSMSCRPDPCMTSFMLNFSASSGDKLYQPGLYKTHGSVGSDLRELHAIHVPREHPSMLAGLFHFTRWDCRVSHLRSSFIRCNMMLSPRLQESCVLAQDLWCCWYDREKDMRHIRPWVPCRVGKPV
jgi:hypothetical protein